MDSLRRRTAAETYSFTSPQWSGPACLRSTRAKCSTMTWSATAARRRRRISRRVDRASFINSLMAYPAPGQIGNILQVFVRDNNVDQALRALKKKLQREGIFREMKRRRAYEKPSERKTREKAEAIRRARKAARKLGQREA